VLRAAYTEPEVPGFAAVTICSPAGGVLQGDRLAIEVALDANAQLRLETQSATRLYGMPDSSAFGSVTLKVGPGAYLEYVPDPLIPYAGAAYRQESTWDVDESATLIAGEVVTAGREARGERARYQRLELVIDARRPGGQTLFSDTCVLVPDDDHSLGFLGDYTTLGSLFVVSSAFRSTMFTGLAGHPAVVRASSGWSDLPNHAGAWFKVMAHDSATAVGAVQAAWQAARRAILGVNLPPKRRF
jgi:urease accessory protein